jgi:hypothetical protein
VQTDDPVLRLIELLENAPRVPVFCERVRVDKVEVLKLVDVITRAAGPSELDGWSTPGLSAALESVRDAIRCAYPIPFTDHVRLSGAHAAALAADLRLHSA